MTTKLDPPPVPPLSAEQRTRLRNRVMHSPVRRTPRPWAVPIAAVAAVAVVIAGATLAAHRTDNAAPPATDSVVPDAIKVDLGPASPAELAKVQRTCKTEPHQSAGEVLWSRKVKRLATVSNDKYSTAVVALMKVSQPRPQPGHSLGILFCTVTGEGHGVLNSAWTAEPTPAQGMLPIDERMYVQWGLPPLGAPLVSADEALGVYRVSPGIARIQSRLVWSGGAGPWYEGVVQDRIAYAAAADSTSKVDTPDKVREFRAFDNHGRPVPLAK